MKKVGVALLGLGVVGGGTYEILKSKRDYIMANDGVALDVLHILERNLDRCKQLGVDENIVTQDINDILNDDRVQVVAEFFGGVEPAKSFLISCLKRGKSVVTANKEMLAKSWHELEDAALIGGGGVYFEASCMGGVPIIRTLIDGMQANSIRSLKGIVNGTTNYILTRMSNEGVDYNTCLEQAKALGYAEQDPTADVEGFDSMYKNSILSSLAYKKRIPIERIYREGISNILPIDIEIAKEMGYTIKLLAISKDTADGVECRVHPALIASDNILASVNDVFNGILIDGDNVGGVMLYGKGAGALPTGSAIVSDVVMAAKSDTHRHFPFERGGIAKDFVDDFKSKYYIRLQAKNEIGEKGIFNLLCDVDTKESLIESCAKYVLDGIVNLVVITKEMTKQRFDSDKFYLNCLDGVKFMSAIKVEE